VNALGGAESSANATRLVSGRTVDRPSLGRASAAAPVQAHEAEGPRRAAIHDALDICRSVRQDGWRRQDRVAPIVERHQVRREVMADAEGLTGDPIHLQLAVHRQATARQLAAGPQAIPRAWTRNSSSNVRSALVRSSTAPSGWRHAPRPRTSPAQRST